MKRILFTISALALAPGLAAAEGFSSGYVTGFSTEAACMNMARTSMDAQFTAHGHTPDTGEGSYSVYGFEVPPGVTQVAVVCSEHNGSIVAAVTGYSLIEDGSRLQTVQDMIDRINGQPPANPTPSGGGGGGSK